ncbi:hypothetical protein T492DRAFT_966082, partial [Pavlovales sp. CCMP2436]
MLPSASKAARVHRPQQARAHIGHGGHAAIALLASFRITHAHSVVKTTIQGTYCMHSAHVAYKGSPARSPRRAGLGQLLTQARPALVHAHHVRGHSTRPSPLVDFKAGTNPLSRAVYLPRELEHPHRSPAGL